MSVSDPTVCYPSIVAAGSPRELGRQHGAQMREKIRAYLDSLCGSLALSNESLRKRALAFEPLFRASCPHLLEEVAGLAEGAGIQRNEALALQLRGELGQIAQEGCTTFVISGRGTADGKILIGQNSDTPAEIEDFGYVLRLRPENAPEILMWTFGGMIGYHGINRLGVAHFANSLGGGPGWKFALSHYPVKRMMLERNSIEGVLTMLENTPVCSNGNYVLCDSTGRILDVELTSAGPHAIEDSGAGFLAHSNHFLCAPYACESNFSRSLPDSFPRLERMRQLIERDFGSITVDSMKAILADHAGAPVGICRHPHDGPGDAVLPSSGKTVCSLIAEPESGRLHVCRGNPCERTYTLHAFE